MKKGMIFYWYKDGGSTILVMAINNNQVMCLESQIIHNDIDWSNEVGEILIEDIFKFS